ncbi:MAG: UDP-N-acetylmuramate dehydrogenase [Patescibacteria group bacterium]
MQLDIQENIKLANYSTFKIGGPAEYFAEVRNEEELLEALNYAKEKNLKFFILGGGSNVLFDDKGFNGIIIKIKLTTYNLQLTTIECGAGLLLSQLVNLAKDNNLSGLEWASGIPGTVGGAIRGNAGAFGSCMADMIEEIKVYNISESRIMNYELRSCKFGYRDSIFKKNPDLIIISAKIKLEKSDKNEIENRMKKISSKRSEKQPTNWIGSAGSFFKNPVVENEELRERFEKEIGSKAAGNKVSAGWLINEAGLKGKKIGNVMVSDKNANFIINTGGGTAEEIIMLSSIIKQRVRNEFGIQLEEEVKYVI